jgi:superkiller protein 3
LECLSQEKPPIKVISALAAIAISTHDDDLIEAALAELDSIPTGRIAAEDLSGQTVLVRYAHALTQEPADGLGAMRILEEAVLSRPLDQKAKLRLAKALIQGDRAAEAVNVLSGYEGNEGAAALRLGGATEILGGSEEGLKSVQKAVRANPWDLEGWETLAWTRSKVMGETAI